MVLDCFRKSFLKAGKQQQNFAMDLHYTLAQGAAKGFPHMV
jgi:hypothetical protein